MANCALAWLRSLINTGVYGWVDQEYEGQFSEANAIYSRILEDNPANTVSAQPFTLHTRSARSLP